MLCADVNVLVHAANTASVRHLAVRTWLARTLVSPEPLALPDIVIASYVRIVTDPRILPSPLKGHDAFALIEWILAHSRTAVLTSDRASRDIFRTLVESLALRGNDVPDAWLAATTMAADATLVTFDGGFRRFPGLRTIDPAP